MPSDNHVLVYLQEACFVKGLGTKTFTTHKNKNTQSEIKHSMYELTTILA